MPDADPVEPVEERLARRLSGREVGAGSAPRRQTASLLRRLAHYDRAVYRSVAQLETPLLDEPMKKLSDLANFSKPWFFVAGMLALLVGPEVRRAARASRPRRTTVSRSWRGRTASSSARPL